MPGERLIFDIETDNLLEACTTLHLIQLGTIDGSEVDLYGTWPGLLPLSEGLARIAAAEQLIGHNVIGFDFPAINKLHPGTLREEQMFDTLVLARLAYPEERSHALMSWGDRLGVSKGDFKGPFDTLTQEMVDYARQDIVVTRALYARLMEDASGPRLKEWGASVALEHEVAWAIAEQERNGFCFDVKAAEALDLALRTESADIERELVAAFPPIYVRDGKEDFVPKRNNKTAGYTAGCPFTKVKLQEFEPSSRQQVGRRLMRLGWRPKEFGADGSPTVDEKTLAHVRLPQAKLMVRYFKVGKALGQLSDGKAGWLKLVRSSGRIHGRVNPNGATTGRMTHAKPNMAQIPQDEKFRVAFPGYPTSPRQLFKARDGWVLVGCDAEGIEARMLGHYLYPWDNGAFADRVVNGKKDDKSDVHSVNFAALRPVGLATRDGAKRLLYALMYGAGDGKLGLTLKDDCMVHGAPPPRVPNKELGLLIRKALSRSMAGFDKLNERAKSRAKTPGYLVGLDGRRLAIRSEHSALNTLLQGGGAVVMKKALALFRAWLLKEGYQPDVDYGLCANVHDEVQIEVRPELADLFGSRFAECIAEAGMALGVRCPLAGAFAMGPNWASTH